MTSKLTPNTFLISSSRRLRYFGLDQLLLKTMLRGSLTLVLFSDAQRTRGSKNRFEDATATGNALDDMVPPGCYLSSVGVDGCGMVAICLIVTRIVGLGERRCFIWEER
jgi:hypothetical protein